MDVQLRDRDQLRKLVGEETMADHMAQELLTMTGQEGTVREAIQRQHTDFLQNITLTFSVDMISLYAIDAFRRHYRVPCVVHRNDPGMPMIRPDSVAISPLSDKYQSIVRCMREVYAELREAGIPPHDAAYILPGAVTCSAQISVSMADLLTFFSVECCSKAQWETRELADNMLALCREVAPHVFDTAGPPCIRSACPQECKQCRREEWDTY